MAYQGHIIVPTTHEHARDVIGTVGSKLDQLFGGHSEYTGEGCWLKGGEPDGKQMREDHVRIVVDADTSREELREVLVEQAEYVKDTLNEEAVLVEIQEVDMILV